MQALLLDRKLSAISELEFTTTIGETYYSSLKQNVGRVFPANCHRNASVNSMSIDTEFNYLLSGCADSSIKLWDVSDASDQKEFANIATVPRKSAHQFGISSIEWFPHDTGLFVTGSFDHTVKIWDTNELSPVHSFDLESRVYSTDINSNALVAVASDQPFIRLLDLQSSASAHTLAGHKGKTLCVQWHPKDPSLLASGGYDGEVKIWDIRRSDNCLCRLDMLVTNNTTALQTENLRKASVKAHSGPVNGIAWDELGVTLYTTGNDDKIRVWDLLSSTFPVNKLINFGPLSRNKYPQNIPLVLSRRHETELQYVLFPSDTGDVFVFRSVDGKMVSRLNPPSERLGKRTTSIVATGDVATYLCGTIDGEIIKWCPVWDTPDVQDIINDEESRELHKDHTLKLASEARHIIDNA